MPRAVALSPGPRSRRALLIGAALAVLVALAAAPAASADLLTPESGGSPNANEIDSLYKILFVIALIIFVVVESLLIYSLVKFRARKGAVAAQIHGNTRLEIGWTVGAAVVLVVVAVITFFKLPAINDPDKSASLGSIAQGGALASVDPPEVKSKNKMTIDVQGRQFIWRYTYPGGVYAYEDMVVPTGTTVTLRVTATDVIHSWWIPKLGGKYDAVPGYTNYGWFRIDKPGVFRGQCAELCGRQHANMHAHVSAVPPAQFQAWLEGRKREIEAANKAAAAQKKTIDAQAQAATTTGTTP
jgi:cytochrome c oxidase subunit 2